MRDPTRRRPCPRRSSGTPHVVGVELVGSRAAGTAGPLSDCDFVVRADDLDAVLDDLPAIVTPLDPLAQQWDRLGPPDYSCYMLMLRGPVKIDLILPDLPHRSAPRWEATAADLPAIDAHAWDWLLWMASKRQGGSDEVVREQLDLLHEHLLVPSASPRRPRTIPTPSTPTARRATRRRAAAV